MSKFDPYIFIDIVNMNVYYIIFDLFKASGNTARPTLGAFDVERVSEKLSGQIVEMNQPEVISSTKIKITWQVREIVLSIFHLAWILYMYICTCIDL